MWCHGMGAWRHMTSRNGVEVTFDLWNTAPSCVRLQYIKRGLHLKLQIANVHFRQPSIWPFRVKGQKSTFSYKVWPIWAPICKKYWRLLDSRSHHNAQWSRASNFSLFLEAYQTTILKIACLSAGTFKVYELDTFRMWLGAWSSSEGGNEHQLHKSLIPGYMWHRTIV